MTRQWPILVRQRYAVWRRGLVRAGWSRVAVAAAGVAVIALCFPAALAAFFWFFSGLLEAYPDRRQLVELVVETVLAAAFLFGAVFSFTAAAREFGQPASGLSAAWPFEPNDIFIVRMAAVAARGSWPSLMVAMPAMLAVGWLSSSPPVFFIWTAAFTVLHAAAAVGIGVFLRFLLIHAEWSVSPPLARMIVIGVLMIYVVYFAQTTVAGVVDLLGGQGRKGPFLIPFNGIAAAAASGITGSQISPLAPIMVLAAIAAICWALVAAFGRMDQQRWLQAAGPSPKPVRRSGFRLWSRFLAPRHSFLHEKERLTFFRDTDGLGRFILLGAMAAALLSVVWMSREAVARGGILWAADAAAVTVAAIGFLILVGGLRFCFPSLSLEGREAWLIRSSPLHIHELFSWKFFFWAGLFAVSAAPPAVLAGVWLGLPAIAIVGMAVISVVVAVVLTAMTVGQGFIFPEFAGPGMRPLPVRTPEYFVAAPAGLMSVVLGCFYLFVVARYVRRFVGWYLVTGEVDGQSVLGTIVVSALVIAVYWMTAPHALERCEEGV